MRAGRFRPMLSRRLPARGSAAAELHARPRTRGSRAPGSERAAGATTSACSCHRGLDAPIHTTFAAAPRSPRARRSGRRQHVGDRRRCPRRRHRRTRRRRPPRLQRAARRRCGWSSRGARSPTARRSDSTSATSRRSHPCRTASHCSTSCAGTRIATHLARRCRRTVSTSPATMAAVGRPIRYPYVPHDWPLDSYQTVFATEPGSAEMPSAARPFTTRDRHPTREQGCGDRSDHACTPGSRRWRPVNGRTPSATECRRRRLPLSTRHINDGGHVIAIGTTVVRALETVTDRPRHVHPGEGWTDLVVELRRTRPDLGRGVRAVDGLLTGWHEPEATHLAMLEAVAGQGAAASSPTSRRSPPGTAGTSSATATSSFPTLDRDVRRWTRLRRHARRRASRSLRRFRWAAAPCSTPCAGSATPRSTTSPPTSGSRASGARQHLTSLTEHGLVEAVEIARRATAPWSTTARPTTSAISAICCFPRPTGR